jgi:aryl-alcohol dehydrogenase-like predicted oxidoreductase
MYAARGGMFLDTADVYGSGSSEICLGNWLQTQTREDFVVATKARSSMGKAPNDGGLSRKHLIAAVEASLERLRTPYIDLFQMHSFDVGA